MGMDSVVVKRYLREEGDDKKYYLSRLSLNYHKTSSLKDYSVSEICKLPYFKDGAPVFGCICDDWMCFHDWSGQFVVYNITTKEVKHIPPYLSCRLDNPDWTVIYRSSGMGYDPKSGDYKVVRSFDEYHQDGYTFKRAELYSLETASLKSIPIDNEPSGISSTCRGVYVGGKYYWPCWGAVECFDFTNETFSKIPEPPKPYGCQFGDYYVILVQCRGDLGLILCPGVLEDCELWMRPPSLRSEQVSKYLKSSTSTSCFSYKRKTFQVWVWKDSSSWTKLYEAALHHVVKPLCLIDGRISLFQGETRDCKCNLFFYDWITKEMKKIGISDYGGHMQVFSAIELPPDPTPYTEEEEEEEEEETGKAWLRPHNASSALELKKKKKKEEEPRKRRRPRRPGYAHIMRPRLLKKKYKKNKKKNRGGGGDRQGLATPT